jgi:Flp pilus assembly pilin Flp
MQTARVRFRTERNRDDGQALVEYLLLVSLVAIGMISVLTSLSGFLNGWFQMTIIQNLNRIPGVQ